MSEKACSKCGETKDLSRYNKRASSPDGRRSECRGCQAAYTKQYNAEAGKAAPDTCRICCGPVQRGSRHGVCRRNPGCLRINVSLNNRLKLENRGRLPRPCEACGVRFIRRRGWGANDRMCPPCCVESFWCSGISLGTGHVASIAQKVDAKCRACRLLRHAQVRARRLGVPFALTWRQVDAVYPDICPYLGIPLETGDGRQHAVSPTLDRLEPARGYVEGNVEVISYLANAMKNSATRDQLVTFAAAVLRRHGTGVAA